MQRARALALAAAAPLAACAGPPSDPLPLVAAEAFVVDSPGRGPQACVDYVLTSMPPRCDGLALVGWDWSEVEGEETRAGTTWVRTVVVGMCDGERFVVARPQPGGDFGLQAGPDETTCYGDRSQSSR